MASGAFGLMEWRRGDRVILKKNPNFWQADRVKLDGVEWISRPRRQHPHAEGAGGRARLRDLRAVLAKSRNCKKDANLNIMLDPSTREDHLLINHEHGAACERRRCARRSTWRSTSRRSSTP